MFKIGHGYDAHKLVAGRKLILGGVGIDHSVGLLGHSDADVLTHAIMDALLGAAAKGDIGKHFPDTDEKYKGISSLVLLSRTVQIVKEAGYDVVNIDSTVVCEAPRLSSHIDAMRENIANAVGTDLDAVSVKATTTEGMGFEGERLGISAHAVVLLQKI